MTNSHLEQGHCSIDPDDFGVATYGLRAVLKVSNGSSRASVALFDLSAPNTVLTGSQVQGTVGEQTGEIVTSGEITMPDGGSAETLGRQVQDESIWCIRDRDHG